MKQKVMKVGNSLGVVVPSSFVKSVGVIRGSKVEVKMIPGEGKVVYTFDGICQLPLESFLKKSA